MTDNDDAQDGSGRDKPPSRADSIRLPAIPPRPRKWPVGPADEFAAFGEETTGPEKPDIDAGPLLASTTQAQTVGRPPTRRRPLIIGLVGAVVAVLAAAIVIWQLPSGGETGGGGNAPAGDVQQAAAAPAPSGNAPPASRAASAGGAAAPPSGQATTTAPASPGGVSHPAGAVVSAPATAAGATPAATRAATAPALAGRTNPSGANLARDGVASASSLEDPRWTAAMAIDGDETASRWSSAYADPQWWKVDLQRAYQLSTVTLFWERAHAVAYRVETSADGSSWKTIYSTSSGQGGTVAVKASGTVARYVRVWCTQRFNEYGYSLYEVEIR